MTALFDQPAEVVARALIGAVFTVDGVGGRIVETEAYDVEDPASHSYGGPTGRNAPMFGPPGRAYVYRIYGLHWCFNIVCDAAAGGSAVLIRALRPTIGLDLMRTRRNRVARPQLCSGPGKLCQALAIDDRLNGSSLAAPPFRLSAPTGLVVIAPGPRIGISVAVDRPWRFAEAGSLFLSRPVQGSAQPRV